MCLQISQPLCIAAKVIHTFNKLLEKTCSLTVLMMHSDFEPRVDCEDDFLLFPSDSEKKLFLNKMQMGFRKLVSLDIWWEE